MIFSSFSDYQALTKNVYNIIINTIRFCVSVDTTSMSKCNDKKE